MPETSILIPTYNCGKYIGECIDSVIKQNYKNYEIVIVDDGSSDGTENFVKSLHDKRIRYFKNERNLGIVKSLNFGIQVCKGDFIARMDADDIMVGDRLNTHANFLESNHDYAMVGGCYSVINGNRDFLKNVCTEQDSESIRLSLLFRNQFAHSSVTIRKDVLQRYEYKETFSFCEDFDLWTRISKHYRTTNLQDYVLIYRWHETNSCNTHQDTLQNNIIELLSRELSYYKIDHSAAELMIHASICFDLVAKFSQSDNSYKSKYLNWCEKLFNSSTIKRSYSSEVIQKVRSGIIKTL